MKNKNTSLLFATYQARKTKAQKTSFIQFASSAAADAGFMSNVENTKNGARNIVIGNLETASVVYTAHYDTASKSPFPTFIFPKAPILTTLYQIALGLLMLLPSALLFAFSVLVLPLIIPTAVSVLLGILLAAGAYIACIYFFLSGPATQNNANSNTSGVATLLEIMQSIPSESRSGVAFVFFDSSVNGLIGSADFAKKHKHLNKKLFVNFDCVGVGEQFIVVQSRASAKFSTVVSTAFASSGKIKTEIVSGVNRLPSDHKNFKCSVGVCAMNSKDGSPKLIVKNNDSDTVCVDENIAYASEAGVKLAELILNPSAIDEIKSTPVAEELAAEEAVGEAPTAVEEAPNADQTIEAEQEEPVDAEAADEGETATAE